MATVFSQKVQPRAEGTGARVIGTAGPAYWLSAALAVAAAAGSVLTFTIPAVLRGPAVMNGSARGTALVVLLAVAAVLAVIGLISAASLLHGLPGGVPGVTPRGQRAEREGERSE